MQPVDTAGVDVQGSGRQQGSWPEQSVWALLWLSSSAQGAFFSLCPIGRPLAFLLGVFLLLPSVGPATAQGSGTGKRHVATITLTDADSGETVDARVGDLIAIRLHENPSTGYAWAIEKRYEDVVILQSVEHVRTYGARVGGGGQRLLTFKAAQAGLAALQLKLWREWEGDASIIERFTVTFRVQP